MIKSRKVCINSVEMGRLYYHNSNAVEAIDIDGYKIRVRDCFSGREYSIYGDELTED